MPDVIIALVPAVGHESLVADGPRVPGCEPERPMLLRRCSCGSWLCPALDGALVGGVHHPEPAARDLALVLYAPGDPKLGMVRAEATVKGFVMAIAEPGPRLFCLFLRRDVPVDHPENATSFILNDPPELPESALDAFALAHLLLQRGKGSEVLVLPVTP